MCAGARPGPPWRLTRGGRWRRSAQTAGIAAGRADRSHVVAVACAAFRASAWVAAAKELPAARRAIDGLVAQAVATHASGAGGSAAIRRESSTSSS